MEEFSCNEVDFGATVIAFAINFIPMLRERRKLRGWKFRWMIYNPISGSLKFFNSGIRKLRIIYKGTRIILDFHLRAGRGGKIADGQKIINILGNLVATLSREKNPPSGKENRGRGLGIRRGEEVCS